jgi:hypothetical protein
MRPSAFSLAPLVAQDLLFLRPDVRASSDFFCMTPEAWVHLIEEMMDLKIQHYAESTMKVSADVARVLHDKRETDRRRLEQIRTELVRTLKA